MSAHAKTKSAGSTGTYKLSHKAGSDLKGNSTGLRNHFGPVKPIAEGGTTTRMPSSGNKQGC